MDDVLYEARNLAADGEGAHCGGPGHQPVRHRPAGAQAALAELLRQLCRIDGIHWVRVHYLYPDEIDEELMEVLRRSQRL